jgi:hypothetical protein
VDSGHSTLNISHESSESESESESETGRPKLRKATKSQLGRRAATPAALTKLVWSRGGCYWLLCAQTNLVDYFMIGREWSVRVEEIPISRRSGANQRWAGGLGR